MSKILPEYFAGLLPMLAMAALFICVAFLVTSWVAYHLDETAVKMRFKAFKDMYVLNPRKWDIENPAPRRLVKRDGHCWYDKINVRLSFIGYCQYLIWRIGVNHMEERDIKNMMRKNNETLLVQAIGEDLRALEKELERKAPKIIVTIKE